MSPGISKGGMNLNSRHRSMLVFAAVVLPTALVDCIFLPTALRTTSSEKLLVNSPADPMEIGSGDGRRMGFFVQEPSERTALHPDFSNSLRQSNQRNSHLVLRGFREAIGEAWKSTVELIVEDQQIALGAIVDADGWVVTKASQLPEESKLICRLFDGRESKVRLVSTSDDLDLALLRIGYMRLQEVNWSSLATPTRGKWVATTDLDPTPAAVGVVSAGVQSVPAEKPRLGVQLTDSSSGAAITLVLPGSGADLAGLQVGDNIDSLDGAVLSDRDAVMARIESCKAGQNLLIGISRGQRKLQVRARLMDLADELLDPTELEVNGSISARRTGFSKVFLHDTVLEPNQCGGPLVDLDGMVVGINIARAGRVTSYALPVDTVRPVISQLVSSAKSSKHSAPTK